MSETNLFGSSSDSAGWRSSGCLDERDQRWPTVSWVGCDRIQHVEISYSSGPRPPSGGCELATAAVPSSRFHRVVYGRSPRALSSSSGGIYLPRCDFVRGAGPDSGWVMCVPVSLIRDSLSCGLSCRDAA